MNYIATITHYPFKIVTRNHQYLLSITNIDKKLYAIKEEKFIIAIHGGNSDRGGLQPFWASTLIPSLRNGLKPPAIALAAEDDGKGKDLRLLIRVHGEDLTLDFRVTGGRGLDRAGPFLGGLDLRFPPIGACDRSGDLDTARQATTQQMLCDRVRVLAGVGCGHDLDALRHLRASQIVAAAPWSESTLMERLGF